MSKVTDAIRAREQAKIRPAPEPEPPRKPRKREPEPEPVVVEEVVEPVDEPDESVG